MDKFLIELLQLNNSVILPDFGAIVIANENTGDVMFNEYLKFNDGKLIALLVANSTMDEQEATNMVAKYVRDIQIQLDKGDSYDIFGLGSFSKEQDGTIVFNGNIKPAEKSTPQEFMGPSPTPVAPPTEEKKEATPLSKPEEPKEETPDKERPELDLSSSTVSTEESSAKEETEASSKKTSTPLAQHSIQKERKKRGVLFWVLIFLLLVLSGGGIFVGIKYEEVKTYMGWNTFEVTEDTETSHEREDSSVDSEEMPTAELTETEITAENTTSTELEEELVSEEVDETVVEEEPIEETIVEQPISGNSFHLIGGSFSSAENAENFAKDLQSKGFPARVLGQFNGLHMVSVKSFSSQGDVFAELKTIQEQAPGAWLFKYPK